MSFAGFLQRAWIPLLIIAVAATGGFVAYRLQGVFSSHRSSEAGLVEQIVPINVKHVEYEISGPPATTGVINYLDENAQPQRADFSSLPWSFTVTTTMPGMFTNVVAQGDSNIIGCRITVNGVVRDQQSATGLNAQVFCLDKAA